MDENGIGERTFATVAVKARAHARHNPYAIHREPLSVDDVLASPVISGRLRRLHACPPSCGAAAVTVCSPRFATRHGLRQDVVILSHAMGSDLGSDLESAPIPDVVGRAATRRAAEKAYAQSGVGPEGIDLAEVHDCFVSNEMIACAALGFCDEDDIESFVQSGADTFGGRVVVGPSGGLLSKGHPPGATGLAQICELAWQLRNEAGSRQVDQARTALQHNFGIGSAVSVAILQRSRAGPPAGA